MAKQLRGTFEAQTRKQITVYAFQGVGRGGEKYIENDPLLYAGHVGVQLKPGGEIYGFTPTSKLNSSDLLERLKNGETFPGQVNDDAATFIKAQLLADAGERTTVYALTFDFEDNPEEYDRITNEVEYALSTSPSETRRYSLPDRATDGRQPGCNNCAQWVHSLGLDIPNTGNMRDFIPQFTDMGAGVWY